MSRLLVVLSFANRKVLHHIIPSGGWHWTGWRKNLQADNLVEIWEHGRSVPNRGNSKCKGPELRELWMGWKHRKGQAWLEISERETGVGWAWRSWQGPGYGITRRPQKEFGFYSTCNEMFALIGISWLLCGKSVKLGSGLDGLQGSCLVPTTHVMLSGVPRTVDPISLMSHRTFSKDRNVPHLCWPNPKLRWISSTCFVAGLTEDVEFKFYSI